MKALFHNHLDYPSAFGKLVLGYLLIVLSFHFNNIVCVIFRKTSYYLGPKTQ